MKKALIVVLVLLLIAGAGVGGYLYAGSKKEDKPVTTEEPKEEPKEEQILDITDPIITKTIDKIRRTGLCNPDYEIASLDYLLIEDSVSASDISNKEAVNYYLISLSFGDSGKTKKISADEMTQKIQSILGKDYKFEHQTYGNFKYDKEKKNYVINLIPFGCTTGPYAKSLAKVTKAIVKGDELTITYKLLFSDGDIGTDSKQEYYVKYYKDYAKKNQVAEKEIDFISSPSEENAYEANPTSANNYNLGSTYEFTFEKQGEEYVFVKSQLMK